MSDEYRYTLEKGSKKHQCPNCERKSLVRYIDTETGDYLPEEFGRCDHESKCDPHYHLNPYTSGYVEALSDQKKSIQSKHKKKPKRKPKTEPVFIPVEVIEQTLQPDRYEHNTFIQNLLTRVEFPFESMCEFSCDTQEFQCDY